MNIFETIEGATSRIEPFHSRFLADALEMSAKMDRPFFEKVWNQIAPSGWEVPEHPEILAEVPLGTGSIDILIRTDDRYDRIVGIEVKTKEESATVGQLNRYKEGLEDKYPEAELAMTYLTPFNEKCAEQEVGGNAAKLLPTVMEFRKFCQEFCRARHVSWLDLADICWVNNLLWEQHREYVREHISTLSLLNVKRNRTLEDFLGQAPTARFREGLADLGIEGCHAGEDVNINLKDFNDGSQSLTVGLVEVLEILISKGEEVSRNLPTPREDAFKNRHEYLQSSFSDIHGALFRLADRYGYVWIEGKKDYGVRVAHDDYRGGVSLIRSVGIKALRVIGGR